MSKEDVSKLTDGSVANLCCHGMVRPASDRMPSNPNVGDIFWHTEEEQLYVFGDGQWCAMDDGLTEEERAELWSGQAVLFNGKVVDV